MLVSASDPSLVIKLSEKESRTRSEISREASACQRNACVPGTGPEASVFPCTELGGQRMAAVTGYPGKKKSFPSVHTWRLLDLRFRSILVPQHISWWILTVIIILTTVLVNPNGSLCFSSHSSHQHSQLCTHTAVGNSSTTHTSRKLPPISVFARNSV